MSDLLLSALSHKLNEQLIVDFDEYVKYLFGYIHKELGATNPMLFIFDDAKQELLLANSTLNIRIPVSKENSLLIDCLNTQELLSTSNSGLIFPERSEFEGSSQILWTLLPIAVFSRPFGVLVLPFPQEDNLSKQETKFLNNFAENISMPVYTSWTLHQAILSQEVADEKNKKFLDLIKVKKSFLEDLQQLLVQCIQQDLFDQKTMQDIVASLAYLHSVLLISDSTIEKEENKSKL